MTHSKSAGFRVIIFVEGDTDELFFRTLLSHYRRSSLTPMLPYSICNLKGVTRYTSKLLAKLRNEYLPDARRENVSIQAVCCSYDTDVFDAGNPLMVDWSMLAKSIKRLGIESFVQVGVSKSIEDWILDDVEGVCTFLKIKPPVKLPRGNDGFAKLSALYATAHRTYQKGYATRELIEALDMNKVIIKREEALVPLEMALKITIGRTPNSSPVD